MGENPPRSQSNARYHGNHRYCYCLPLPPTPRYLSCWLLVTPVTSVELCRRPRATGTIVHSPFFQSLGDRKSNTNAVPSLPDAQLEAKVRLPSSLPHVPQKIHQATVRDTGPTLSPRRRPWRRHLLRITWPAREFFLASSWHK